MQIWDPSEIGFLSSRIHKPTREIYLEFCDEFGTTRSYDSIQKKVKKLRDGLSGVDDDDETLPEVEELLSATPQTLHITQATVDKRTRLRDEAKAWLQGLIEITKDLTLLGPREANTDGQKTSLILALSDLHFGKQTEVFNLQRAKDRLLSIADALSYQPLPELDEIVVLIMGDCIEGEDIFPTQAHHIECSALEQTKACTESIWTLLLKLKAKFNLPIRIETCPGNHGRTSRTANEKTNWDNVIYHILNVMVTMAHDPMITMNCNFEEFRRFKVKDKVGLITHQGVKHTGTPSMREKVAGWSQSKQFDFLVHGHWHEWHVGNWLGKCVVGNGCLCGPDDLAERMAREDTARQAYFLITPAQPIWGFSFLEWT